MVFSRKDLVRVEATVIEKTESWPKINMRFWKRHNYQRKKSKMGRAESLLPCCWGAAGGLGDTSVVAGEGDSLTVSPDPSRQSSLSQLGALCSEHGAGCSPASSLCERPH